MTQINILKEINSEVINNLFKELKNIYNTENIDSERKEEIISLVKKYGYLPYPHVKGLETLSPAEVIAGLEAKFEYNNTYQKGNFNFEEISPVKRLGYSDTSWAIKEQHNIKLINLAALGNGNEDKTPGRFIDWLKQLLILPAGNIEKNVLGTTAYLIPFHPRDFGCAYLPTSSDVSPNLEDNLLKENLNINSKEQVKLFLSFLQLGGHPVIYDVLPQTGRFSKTVLAFPAIARWFDIKAMFNTLSEELQKIAEIFRQHYPVDDVDYMEKIVKLGLKGKKESYPEHLTYLEERFHQELTTKKKELSNKMLLRETQAIILERVKSIIEKHLGKSENLSEEDINCHSEIIGDLISNGLWPSPGGAWNSSGIPIFDKMSNNGNHPEFKHYDYKDKDVTDFANLDCQTPFYFVYLENGEFNEKVVNFYIEHLKKLQKEYNFDGYRVDHIDHIVDKFSESENGTPISYRAPRYVLGKANRELKKDVPHFVALAEYMLWDNFYKEYHNDMNFDLLWGNDIVSQHSKTVSQIINDNKEIEKYNSEIPYLMHKLSILKTYNNQDGEFREINQYPGQLGLEGALFKFFKMKFIPGGAMAQRPVLYIDGDESYTKTGIEKVIGSEESMTRAKNKKFYNQFTAINNFALNNSLNLEGRAELHQHNEGDGFVSWYIKSENPNEDNERLLIVANEYPPTEIAMGEDGFYDKQNEPVYNKLTHIPDGFDIVCEYKLEDGVIEFIKNTNITNRNENNLYFEVLNPSEYYIYKIKRV